MTDQGHKLGDVLRSAREAKGVDLVRVERDTKIRERYLSALELGDYRELPGAVYTKGFLRNYGAYLGLDPEYLIDLYRLETVRGSERSVRAAPPRPLGVRRQRAFVLTPGVVVAAILTVLVGGFIAYLGYEFVNFARTPELRITEPAGNVNAHPDQEITLRGMTAPNARVEVGNLRENPSVTAEADGSFEITVQLVPGSNVVELVAHDPVTGRDSETETRTIVVATEPVPTDTATPVALALTTPAADATVGSEVEVAGTAAPGAEVTLAASLLEPPVPAFTVTNPSGGAVQTTVRDPGVPEPVVVDADATGAFTGTIALAPGRWTVSAASGGAAPVERTVTVAQPDGLRVVLRLDGGDSYVELEQDGVAAEASGTIAAAGETIELSAAETVRIRAGNAGAVQVAVNGVGLGSMGNPGDVVEWIVRARAG